MIAEPSIRSGMRQFPVWLSCVFCLVATVACGPADDRELLNSDPMVVRSLAGNVSDASRRKDTFAALFTAKIAVDEKMRKQYGRYSYRAVDHPNIDGYRATINVLVRDRMDKELGTVEWKAVREGDVWKLDFVDLPPGVK